MVTALISLFISLCYVSGQDALINELVDFITTAQIDEKLEMHTGNTTHVEKLELRNEVVNNSIMKWLYSHTHNQWVLDPQPHPPPTLVRREIAI